MTDHNESAAANPTNGHGTPRPVNTVATKQRPISRAEIEKLARAMAKECVRLQREIAELKRVTGLSGSTQLGAESISPVVKNYFDALVAPVRQLVWDLDQNAVRLPDHFKTGRTYKRGKSVVFKGGVWAALGCTDTRPGTSDWKLIVKSGAVGPRDEIRKNADDT